MTPKLPDYPCCLVLPYHVTIYRDGYTPPGEKQTPYMTDSGRVYAELTTKDIAILEQGGLDYEKIRARVKEIAQKGLDHDMTRSIEQHEGIGGYNSWILPLITRKYASFIMLTDVKTVLRGTHVFDSQIVVLPHIWGTDELMQKSLDGIFALEAFSS